MTTEQAKKIVELAERDGVELSVYEGYSGRGMYGKKTTAVTGHRDDISHYAALANVPRRTLTLDQLGMGHVGY